MPIAQEVVKTITDSLYSEYKEAYLDDVFRIIRKSGIEMDLSTVAMIYMDQNNVYEDGFTSMEDIYAMLNSSLSKILLFTPKPGTEIGKLSPASEAAIRVMNTIQKAMDLTIPDDSVQKQLQTRLVGAAKRILLADEAGKEILKAKKTNQDSIELIKHVFDLGNNHPDGIFGRLSSGAELWEQFKSELNDMKSILDEDTFAEAEIKQMIDVLQDTTYEILLNTNEARSALNDILKKAGFTKVKGDKVQVDWDQIKKINPNIYKTILDVLKLNGVPSIGAIYAAKTLEREYNRMLQQNIKQETENILQDKGQLERYSVLATENPEAFNNARNNAMLSAIGLGNVNIATVINLRTALQNYNLLIKNPRTAFSPTYKAILERKIRNDIERAMEKNGTNFMQFSRNYQLASQFGMGLILSNAGNIIENTLSGISGMIDAAFSEPTTIFEAVKRGMATGLDVAKGGVRIGAEKANINAAAVNLDDRTTAQENNAKWKVWANLFQRITLSATDALFGQAIYSAVEFRALRKILKSKGLSTKESNLIINELYFKNSNEIENLADSMIKNIESFGIKPNKQMRDRIINELLISNMDSAGENWTDLANMIELKGNLELSNKIKSTKLQAEILVRIRDVANAVRARAMGHQADTMLGAFLEKAYSTDMNNAIEKNMKRASEARTATEFKSENRKQAGMELARGFFGNAIFARRGALNWAFLGLARSTGLPLLSTLIFDIGIRGLIGGKLITENKLATYLESLDNEKNKDSFINTMDKMMENMEYTYAVRQRLVRNTLGVLLGGISASIIIGYMKKDCDDNDPDCIAKKVKKWKDKGYLRSIEKLFPYILNGYLNNQLDEFGKIRPESERANSIMDYYKNSLTINGITPAIETYKTYVEKNGIANDKIIVPILNMLFPPKYVEEHEKNGYRMATMGDMISSAVGLRHMKAIDVWRDRLNAYTGANDDKNIATIKQERLELIPETFVEGFLSQVLERNVMRWYLKNYGHLSPESMGNRNSINLIGIGEKTSKKLEEIGIKTYSDLSKMSVQELDQIKGSDKKSIFSPTEAVNVFNQVNNLSISTTGKDIEDYDFDENQLKKLKQIGIKSIGTENKQYILKNIIYLYKRADKNDKKDYKTIIDKLK
jgi:hypothetical protein